jgi:peptidoglycan/xylan/chitin deacetylase (PgdA/CDA1 family)
MPLILMYHRIADEPIDPWDLAVSPAHFEEQLRVLRRTRHPLPLTEFVRNLIAGTLPLDAVALTFDDGYVDNLVAAKPRLAAADVPATVFLATGYLNGGRKFWWDELAQLLLCGSGPRNFEVIVRGQSIPCDIGDVPLTRQDVTAPAAPSRSRHTALMTIWQALRRLKESERELVMHNIRSIFTASDYHGQPEPAMTNDEVKKLVADGLVTIGAHTVTHPSLPTLETVACRREITESKLACEELIGRSVSTFAYPYGDFDAKSREEVGRAGFAIACSTQRRPVVAVSDVLALPRIYVTDLDGDGFEQTLQSVSGVT